MSTCTVIDIVRLASRAAAVFVLSASSGWAARSLPDDNLAYPVLVDVGGLSRGSGFDYNAEKTTFLVTAKHVVLDDKGSPLADEMGLLSYSKAPSESGRNLLHVNITDSLRNGHVRVSESRDIVAIALGNRNDAEHPNVLTFHKEVSPVETTPSGLLGVSRQSTVAFRNLLVGNEVYVFGYPSSLGIDAVPQIDKERPLLRKGVIAGTNPKQSLIILDCPIYGGNSGGPVVQVEDVEIGERRFQVVGMVIQFVPFAEVWENKSQKYSNIIRSNSGYAVAEPMDDILELLK